MNVYTFKGSKCHFVLPSLKSGQMMKELMFTLEAILSFMSRTLSLKVRRPGKQRGRHLLCEAGNPSSITDINIMFNL